MKLVVVLLLLIGAASQALAWHKPDFCGKSECPHYKLEDDRDSYQVRTYKESHWVHYNASDTKYEVAYTKAAAKLMKYFKGANEDEVEMDITTPTLAAMKLSKDASSTERDYVFSMWIDPEGHEGKSPPKPSDEEVEIKCFEDTTVYVREFGGFATESTILQETKKLHEELVADNEDFDDKMVFVAVYDPAVKLLNRHNEVHVMEKGEKPEPDFMPTV